jgi:hypothetical protein
MAGPFALASQVKAKLLTLLPKPLNTAADGQVLTADSSSTVGVSWKTPPAGSGGGGTVVDATVDAKGVVRLAGDLAGTADAPTLKQLRAQAVTVGASDTIPVLTIDTSGRVTGATGTSLSLTTAAIAGLDEFVQDQFGAHLKPGAGVTVNYDDATGDVTISATGGGGGGGTDESYLVSMRRADGNGTYSTVPATQPDTTLWWIGAAPPSSDNPALENGAIFSMLDASA